MTVRRRQTLDIVVAATLGASALTACAVGPRYVPPAPPQAQTFRNAPVDASAVSTGGEGAQAEASLRAWWTGFGDPELVSLVDRALRGNLDLAQAEARRLQARAAARAALAALAPAGRLSGQGEYQRASLQSPLGRIESAFPGYGRDQQLYDLDVAASWEADLFGGLRRSAEAARARYQASEAARAGAQLTVAAGTADAYVQVRALQVRLEVARDQAQAQSRLLALARLRYARGVAARLEVDQAQGALSAVEASVPALQAALEAETNSLEVMVGVEPGSLHAELARAAAIPRAPSVRTAGGPAALLRRRPDLIAAERNLAAANAGVGQAIADYYPKITLSGALGYEASDIGHLIGPAAWQPQGLVGVSWRLFDFGRVDAEVAAACGARAEALAAYRQSVLQATADVETSLAAVARREEEARTLNEGEIALVRARQAAQAAYAAGRLSLIEVLDADQRLLTARDQRVQAQADAARAAISSFKALGGGWGA